MCFDILPEGRDEDRSCLGVNSQQASKSLVQFKLQGLIVQQKQYSAADVLVSRSLHLEAVGLLGGRVTMPFDQMVVGTIQILE